MRDPITGHDVEPEDVLDDQELAEFYRTPRGRARRAAAQAAVSWQGPLIDQFPRPSPDDCAHPTIFAARYGRPAYCGSCLMNDPPERHSPEWSRYGDTDTLGNKIPVHCTVCGVGRGSEHP